MSTPKLKHSLADYVVIALSPGLIMALVGSLVFFLLDVLYVGKNIPSLKWALFFFVFGAVLVARISIELDAQRATLYGLVLAGATWLSMQRYVDYPEDFPLKPLAGFINLGLILLTWWSAYRLTWDCTHIDDAVEASGEGLLQATGLGTPQASRGLEPPEEASPPAKARRTSDDWWERWQRFREESKKRAQNPGKWVVYFSLAALPLFGLGQSLVPADDVARRRYTFWLMVIYAGSGLGLLLTTCFLGLRRYLRQRGVRMPVKMTAAWLTVGGLLIAGLLFVGAIFPRPHAEYPLVPITPVGSAQRDASQYAYHGKGGGKDQGHPSSTEAQRDPQGRPVPGKQGQPGDQQAKDGGSGSKSGKDGSGRQGDSQQGGGKEPGKAPGKSEGKAAKDKQEKREGGGSFMRSADPDRSKEESGSKSGDSGKRQSSSSSSGLSGLMGGLATLLKWVIFAVIALLVIGLLFYNGLRYLANFTEWARRLLESLRAWWAGLFGSGESGEGEPAETEEKKPPPPRPFASFTNPFLDGSAERMPPGQLVRYSFDALQAWARENGQTRQPDETPLEFARRLGDEVPALEESTRRLGGLYARAAYARGSLTPTCLPVVREFWDQLEATAGKPLSA